MPRVAARKGHIQVTCLIFDKIIFLTFFDKPEKTERSAI